jgi:hypothetical protein
MSRPGRMVLAVVTFSPLFLACAEAMTSHTHQEEKLLARAVN